MRYTAHKCAETFAYKGATPKLSGISQKFEPESISTVSNVNRHAKSILKQFSK